MVNVYCGRRFHSILLMLLGMLSACTRALPDQLREVSGLLLYSPSPETDFSDKWLMINDGGHPPVLWIWSPEKGSSREGLSPKLRSWPEPINTGQFWLPENRGGTARLANQDWEAITKNPRGDTICICDIGDNARQRPYVSIYQIVPGAQKLQTFRLQYPDGPRDAEACALKNGQLYIVDKPGIFKGSKHRTHHIYRADLKLENPSLNLLDSFVLRHRSVTDMVFEEEDRLLLLSYDFSPWKLWQPTPVSLYRLNLNTEKSATQADVLDRKKLWQWPGFSQYEALALDEGRILIASEKTIWRGPRYRYLKWSQ